MLSPETRPASARRALERRARHQRLDALVDVAEPLLQAHHRLAIGGEAEMAGLDDAGMHRADRDLVQALALGRQEGVGRARRRRRGVLRAAARASGRGRARAGVVEALRLKAVQIADRALQPDRRRVHGADRGNRPSGARQAERRRCRRPPRRSSAMCTAPGSPHRPSSVSRRRRRAHPQPPPGHLVERHARPWPVAGDRGAAGEQIEARDCRPSRSLAQKLRHVLEPCHERPRQIDAGDEHQSRWANSGT